MFSCPGPHCFEEALQLGRDVLHREEGGKGPSSCARLLPPGNHFFTIMKRSPPVTKRTCPEPVWRMIDYCTKALELVRTVFAERCRRWLGKAGEEFGPVASQCSRAALKQYKGN